MVIACPFLSPISASLQLAVSAKVAEVSEVTRILDAAQNGDSAAADQLLPLVYNELRKLAAAGMANEKVGQTLQPTALVHEAWLKIAGLWLEEITWREISDLSATSIEAKFLS